VRSIFLYMLCQTQSLPKRQLLLIPEEEEEVVRKQQTFAPSKRKDRRNRACKPINRIPVCFRQTSRP
jgi:hypothetical protein